MNRFFRFDPLKSLTWLALLFLAFAMLAGLSSAQTVTIHTDNAKILVEWGNGGTVAKPFPEGGGFYSIDLPDRMGVLITTNGKDQRFRRITTDRHVIYTAGSRPLLGEFGVDYIPDDSAAYRRGTSHELLSGEALPVLFPHDRYLPPSQAAIQRIQVELRQVTNLDAIAQWPRAVRMLQMFDDRGVPQRAPFPQTDMGWLIRNWDYTTGERPMVGWYNGVCPRGAGGFDNWHYNGLLWLAVHYIAAPRDDLYEFGVRQAIAHACFGRSWSGAWAGFARYEKGDQFIGQNFEGYDHAWEKQWSAGLIVWARMTDNPILRMQVDLMREQLRKSDPNTIWQGQWGARIGSHYLEELLIHYLDRREEWIVDKARAYLANVKKWQLSNHCWPNNGNGGTAEESPWMQTQLVSAIFRWLEVRPDLGQSFSVAEALEAGEAVWTRGSTRYFGKPMLKYRFLTKEVPPDSMHITALAVPMLRFMATYDPPKYSKLFREVESFVYDFADTDLSGVVSGTPTPISQLGWRFPPAGHGHYKVVRLYLEGLR